MRELCPGEAFLLSPSPAHEMKKEELYVVPHSHSKFHAKGASRVAGSRSPQRCSLSPTMVVFLSPRLDLCSFDHFGKCVHGLTYRVAHLLRERFMLTSNSKFRHRPRSQDKFTAKRNFKFRVNISLSRSRWATLYSYENRPIHNPG